MNYNVGIRKGGLENDKKTGWNDRADGFDRFWDLCMRDGACRRTWGKAEATRTAAAETEIELQIGERTFSVMLPGHAASRQLIEQMPMEITMKELNGNEK